MTSEKHDISHRQDLESLVGLFYEKAMVDEEIGHFFTDVIELNLEVHLPRIVDFWCSLILGHSSFKGNPMVKHIALSRKEKLTPDHFQRWLQLWSDTVREQFEGPNASITIQKAEQIAGLMMHKIKMDELV